MSSAHLLRLQIEAALANRIPSALTPLPRVFRPMASTGIAALDGKLGGGLPLGAITELAGPECSGRTTLALAFVAGLTQSRRVCAWIDVSDTLDPESAAASGVDLERLLWVRCGETSPTRESTGFEVAMQADSAVSDKGTIRAGNKKPEESLAPRCAEPQPTARRKNREMVPSVSLVSAQLSQYKKLPQKPWSRLDRALRATDLLLQGGGFSAIVLDLGSIVPEFALRVPLATWFRYRAAAERTQASVVLLTQQACVKSSAGLVLRLYPGEVFDEGTTVLTGTEFRVEMARERFAQVTEFTRKPPQSDPTGRMAGRMCGSRPEGSGNAVRWRSHTAWSDRANGSKGGS